MKTLAWPLEPDEIQAALRAMRFDHCKWDIFHRGQSNFLTDAIVLSQAEHELLTSTAAEVWQALRKLEAAVIADPEALASVGVPPDLQSTIRAPMVPGPRLTRCDFHLVAGGQWLISEFNEDGPGGFAESYGLNAVLSGQWADRFAGLVFAGDIRAALVDAFRPWPSIGLVYPTAYSEDLQQVALIADWLREAGHTAVAGSPANLTMTRGRARLFDQPIEALFRYFPGEWIGDLPNFEHWRQASAVLPMMNSLAALVAQSKRFYAAASEHELDIPADARQSIARHLPPSRYLVPAMRDQLLAERVDWVLKGAFGRMGNAVRLGIGYSPEQWREMVDQALHSAEPYAIQACFDAVPSWFSNGLGYATIGVYLVEGRFAGYYSRVSPIPVINYDSCHVATLVETT